MPSKHDPDPRFIDNLEWQLAGELRRRASRVGTSRAPVWRLARLAALVVISVTVGGVAVAASQRMEDSRKRELLEARLEIQHDLAIRRIDLHERALEAEQRQAAVGAKSDLNVIRMRLEIENARDDAHLLQLDLEELRASGREPQSSITAPLVGTRDFVSERLQTRIGRVQRYRDAIATELRQTRRRVDVGVADRSSLAQYEMALEEQRLELEGLEQRLDLRASFVRGDIGAAEAELRVMQADAAIRQQTLDERRTMLEDELARLSDRVAIGVENELSLAAYELQLAELEAELQLATMEQEMLEAELRERREQLR